MNDSPVPDLLKSAGIGAVRHPGSSYADIYRWKTNGKNATYNGTIAPGAAVSFGFQGAWTSNDAVPTAFTLNGTACTTG